MDPKDYYAILEVSENATLDQIKLAYRSTAMRYHPDKNKSPLADDKMKKINEAYEVLSDKQKRQEYDYGKNRGGMFRVSSYNVYNNYSSNNTAKAKRKEYTYNFNSDYNFDRNRYDYSKIKVSVWWQMFYAIIPFVNFLAFYRIQRLEMALTSSFPLLIGIITLLTILSNSYFHFRFEDKFNLFLIMFNGALVFFIRRWSIKWNEQINRGEFPEGDKIDKKVNVVWQLIFSIIPFINYSAFARIHHFWKSVVIGVPTYIVMAIVASLVVNTSPLPFIPVYLGLTSAVFLFFMYRWTIRYNSGKWDRCNDNWKSL
ncbi:MAG: DnaJ domain-containing protein [Candidatus Nitrosocosmicus sp.]